MQNGLYKQAAIVGIGATEFSRDSGRSELTLALQAISAAIADAGLTPKDIDGLLKFQVDANGEGEIAAASARADVNRVTADIFFMTASR